MAAPSDAHAALEMTEYFTSTALEMYRTRQAVEEYRRRRPSTAPPIDTATACAARAFTLVGPEVGEWDRDKFASVGPAVNDTNPRLAWPSWWTVCDWAILQRGNLQDSNTWREQGGGRSSTWSQRTAGRIPPCTRCTAWASSRRGLAALVLTTVRAAL